MSEKFFLPSKLKQSFGFEYAPDQKSLGCLSEAAGTEQSTYSSQDPEKLAILFRYKLAVSYCKLLASHEKLMKEDDENSDDDQNKGPNYLKQAQIITKYIKVSELKSEIEELQPHWIMGMDEDERQRQFQFIQDKLIEELNKVRTQHDVLQ